MVFAAICAIDSGSKLPTFELAGLAMAVLECHSLLRHAPDLGGALAQLGDRLAGGIDDDHAAGEGGAAAGRDAVEAERMGVGHDGAHFVDRDAELLGRHHADRDARAGNVGGAEDERDRAVGRDIERAGRLAAAIEPEARRRRRGLGRAAPANCNARDFFAASSVSTKPIGPKVSP